MISKHISGKAEELLSRGEHKEALMRHLESAATLGWELANDYALDSVLAVQAAFWHDVARGWSDEAGRIYRKEFHLSIDYVGQNAGIELLHGPIAAHLWSTLFGSLPDLELAVARHTLGSSNPGLLEKITALADAGAYDRQDDSAEQLRQAASKDLDEAYRLLLELKIARSRRAGWEPHPHTVAALNAMQRRSNAS